MSTDLRALLQDLADTVAYTGDDLALADRSYAAGRRRRRVRHLEISSAVALVVLIALFAGLFVGSAPLAARYGSSGGTTVTGYPSHIGQQFPVLDLPAKPGPIAGLLAGRDGWWAVSAHGHRWNLPRPDAIDGNLPGLSPDGRLVGYGNTGAGTFVIRDLVTGTVTSIPGFDGARRPSGGGYRVQGQSPPWFSADDRYLAVVVWGTTQAASLVIDVAAGKVVGVVSAAFAWGWSGDRLVLDTAAGLQLHSMKGGSDEPVRLNPPDPFGGNQGSPIVSRDGSQVALMNSTSVENEEKVQQVARYDLPSGRELGQPVTVPSLLSYSDPSLGKDLTYLHRDPAFTNRYSVVAVDALGRSSTRTTIDGRLDPQYGTWAADAFDGFAQSPLELDRLDDWLLRWSTPLWWTLGLALCGLAFAWRVRLAIRQPLGYPTGVSSAPWSRRRRLWVAAGVLVPSGIVLALLTAYVLVPAATGDLVSTQAIWWSPSDEAAARSGGMDGDPASLVVEHPGQEQGFALLVDNPTSQDQRVSGPSENTMAGVVFSVATSAGTAAQARTLTYRPSAVIPAHESRWVHVGRAIDPCVEGNSDKKGTSSLPSLTIGVRIGWLSRDELIGVAPARAWLGACP